MQRLDQARLQEMMDKKRRPVRAVKDGMSLVPMIIDTKSRVGLRGLMRRSFFPVGADGVVSARRQLQNHPPRNANV